MTPDDAAAPRQIAPELVREFDIFDSSRMRGDLYGGLAELQQDNPDVFWTPRNGGHWVVTRYDLLKSILQDPGTFSSRQTAIPLVPDPKNLIPLNLDPPDNTFFRILLMRYFSAPAIRALEPSVRASLEVILDEVVPQGACEFEQAIGAPFPVSVFMKILGIPFSRFQEFRDLVVSFFTSGHDLEQQRKNIAAIKDEVSALIAMRRAAPEDDLVTKLLTDEVSGRKLTQQELEAVCFLLILAGLDTVASVSTCLFHRLAKTPELQRELREHPERIESFVEEGLRTSGVVHCARVATREVELAGARIAAGDAVLCMLPAAGLDERVNAAPGTFKLDREGRQHLIFGGGVHLCLGHILARLELRVLTEEWLKRVPAFATPAGFSPEYRLGQVVGLKTLPLVWDLAAGL
jgi:cytochrome P450